MQISISSIKKEAREQAALERESGAGLGVCDVGDVHLQVRAFGRSADYGVVLKANSTAQTLDDRSLDGDLEPAAIYHTRQDDPLDVLGRHGSSVVVRAGVYLPLTLASIPHVPSGLLGVILVSFAHMKDYKRVHFIGVGGIGTSAMAKLLKLRGVYVSGSDLKDSETLKELRHMDVQIWTGSRPDKIGKDVELIVYSSAVPEDDEERIRGRHIDAKEMTYNEFLGELSKSMKTIAVTGTHGKSTTTAMLGHILIEAGMEPTVVVGSKVSTFKYGNLHVGSSDLLVVEACEYKEHMLHIDPSMVVLTNIEFDHPDYYKSIDDVMAAMQKFIDKLPDGGSLIWNTDDEESKEIVEKLEGVSELGVGDEGAISASVERASGEQVVHVKYRGMEIGEARLKMPGEYNVQNALMAAAAAYKLGLDPQKIRSAIESFTGLWRRFEHIGKYRAADMYSDYAHHPTAIAGLLEGAKTFLPDRRIVLCYEPHENARTTALKDEFVAAFDDADFVLITETFKAAGRDTEDDVSSHDLVEAVKKHDEARGVSREVLYVGDVEAVGEALEGIVNKDDVVLMAGAGKIDEVARKLV